MNPTLPLRARQAAALGILFIAVLLVWDVIIGPIIDLAASRQHDVVTLSHQVRQLQEMERQSPSIGKRDRAAAEGLQSLDIFWSGSAQTSISSAMQDIIRAAAQQSGGIVSSSSTMLPDLKTDPGVLSVRARIDGSLDTLQHVLTAIDGARPRLFLNNLAVSATAPATRDRPAQLSFELSVSGYLAGAHHAR